jgi:TonB family protein
MASSPRESVPSASYLTGSGNDPEGPATGTGRPSRPPAKAKGDEPLSENIAILISVLVHGLGLLFIGLSALMAPHRPSEVPVFELVNLEKPKLRPLTPKVQPPPEPPPPEPEPVRPPEAPKLTPTPTKAVQPKKPEPKVVKEKPVDEEPRPIKEVVPEPQVLENQAVLSIPQDPRLSLWASRLKRKVDLAWKAPSGIEVSGSVRVVVNFTVTRDGTISGQTVAESSGNSELDELALMTFQRIGTVAPIPENFPNEQIEVRSELTYVGQ